MRQYDGITPGNTEVYVHTEIWVAHAVIVYKHIGLSFT